jgi:hypothetical protein
MEWLDLATVGVRKATTIGSDREGNDPVEPSGDERRGRSIGEELGEHGVKGRTARRGEGWTRQRREGGGSLEADASPTYSPHGLPCFFLEQFCFSFGSISVSGDVKS